MISSPEYTLNKPYSRGSYNVSNDDEQWIRLSEGCPNRCSYCAESWENGAEPIYYEIPEIVCNRVNILDMNLIYKPKSLEIIKELGQLRVNNKIIKYSLQCGVDWRHLTQELASALKRSRFIEMRLAWDYGYEHAYKIKDALNKLIFAGYNPTTIQVFMICNWKTSYQECCMKLDTLKIWNVQVSDCWFDNQKKGKVEPRYWNKDQIQEFGKLCRDHNIMIRGNGVQVEFLKKDSNKLKILKGSGKG